MQKLPRYALFQDITVTQFTSCDYSVKQERSLVPLECRERHSTDTLYQIFIPTWQVITYILYTLTPNIALLTSEKEQEKHDQWPAHYWSGQIRNIPFSRVLNTVR